MKAQVFKRFVDLPSIPVLWVTGWRFEPNYVLKAKLRSRAIGRAQRDKHNGKLDKAETAVGDTMV